MNEKLNILVIVGTTRNARSGKQISDWYISEAQKTAGDLMDFKVVDLQEWDLPLFNEDTPPMYHQYSELQNKIAGEIDKADGFVFVTGEYNHSIPGSLKNLLDYIGAEWNKKPAAYVGYGATGATRAIEHLIQILSCLGVASMRGHITVNAIWDALDGHGIPKDGYWFGDFENHLQELAWWANALKAARE
ncbi:MAG: NAD(P)H-dependent oxidoreductase [Spirochaetales bacterium]|nr:NAD(P)H-dependent oxidoreductase [Spirochaetales bacterium]